MAGGALRGAIIPPYQGDYAETLSKAWADAQAARRPDAPTVVSLFAGCGGSSLGYQMAGYDERLAVEWDEHAASCLRLNFPDLYVWHGDIADLDAGKALGLAMLEPGQLDVLDGSPPCQGVSTTGKRRFDDPRNSLFKEYVRFLEAFRPKAFVMENVSGLVKGKMRLIFRDVMAALKGAGYAAEARVLNAAFFGVPQSRERVIFVGVRDDVGTPSFPPASSSPVPAKVALRGCPEDDAEGRPRPIPERYEKWWHAIKPGDNASDLHDAGTHFNVLAKLDPERPAQTIVKSAGDSTYASMVHWSEPRFVTPNEALRLASFPDEFRLIGKYGDRMARIGNSVPPLMMRAIARHVAKILEEAKAHA